MKIGVFDSGVGGLSVANAIQAVLPMHEILLREDKVNLPYGTKTPSELYQLVNPIIQEMVADNCKVIVIACNTVTTNIIEDLRRDVSVPLVGMEPMVKPAAERSKTGVIAVCATPATLRSERYANLKSQYANGVEVIEPDCSRWAQMIEDNLVDRQDITANIRLTLEAGADVVVLGCTHYHWIEDLILDIVAGKAEVLQPEQPVIEQLKRVLARLA